jgi:glycerol uptake facilitator-like aquaporin
VLNLVKLGAILLGSIAGAAIVLALNIPTAGKPEYLGGAGFGTAFFAEFIGAGLLMWVLLVTNYDRVSKWRNLTQGFVLIGLSALLFPRTTAAFNFARWFGAAVVTGDFDNTDNAALAYFFGPLVGQLVFALVWFFLFRYPTKKLYKEKV